MSGGSKVEARSKATDFSAFDRNFAELPDEIRVIAGRVPTGAGNLWLQLLALGNQRTCEFWLASSKSGGHILARIGADIPAVNPSQGSIGFFDCVDSPEGRAAGAELISTALAWLKDSNADNVVAPMDFNSWFNYRFKIRSPEEFRSIDKPWEPAAPEFHKELFQQAGFNDHLYFSSMNFRIPDIRLWDAYLEKLQPDHTKVIDSGYVVRPFATGSDLIQDLRQIFELSNLAFADNPMFEKIPFELFSGLTLALAKKSNMDASRIVLAKDGQAVAFAFCFSEGEELVYKTVAVHPEHRSKGIANALTWEISSWCRNHKISKTTGALIRAGNVSEKIGKSHGSFADPDAMDRYVLLRKVIA
ncbi:MAG: hypothetical protein RI953_772 [Pseudomonadota bacterium]|jgi:predicted GNAT family acetyltransferase